MLDQNGRVGMAESEGEGIAVLVNGRDGRDGGWWSGESGGQARLGCGRDATVAPSDAVSGVKFGEPVVPVEERVASPADGSEVGEPVVAAS